MGTTKLTDFQTYALTTAITQWDAANKAAEKKVLDLELFKKLFAIRSAIRDTYDAVVASDIEIGKLYAKKETNDYKMPLLSQEDFNRIVGSVEQYEIFSWITDGLSA